MGELSEGTRALALACQLLDQADPTVAATAVRRATVVDTTATTMGLDPSQRWVTLGAALVADLGPTLLGCDETAGATRTAELLDALGAHPQGAMSEIGAAVRHRFERVDGRGEPSGLTEHEIPLAARLLAIADVLVDALSDQPIPWERRRELVKDQAGTVLDLDLADACLRALDGESNQAAAENGTIDDMVGLLERLAALAESEECAGARFDTVAAVATRMAELIETAVVTDGLAITCADSATGEPRNLARRGIAADLPAASFAPLASSSPSNATGVVTLAREGVGAVAAAPVARPGEHLGFLVVVRSDETCPFDPWEQRLIGSAARAIGLTADWEVAQARLRRLAHTDPLTGLANRWLLEERLDALYRHPDVDRADSALIMADVDQLKAVNDRAGHSAGDALLRRVAGLLVEAVDRFPQALVCRIGGDEFCILMESNGLLDADSIVTTIEESARVEGIGISAGTGYAVHCESAAGLLAEADAAQYETKRRRRPEHSLSGVAPPGRGRRAHRDR